MSKRKLSFKWFGTISRFSFRRSSDKSPDALTLKHHGSLCETSTEKKSIDDMDMCPRNGSYARSSDMYSHTGTMPRFSLKKNKESKKNKGKTELRRNQSQRQPADYVCDSPLLSVLSSQGASTAEPLSSMSKPDQANPTQSSPAESTESPSPVNPAASRLTSPVSPTSSSQPALAESAEEWAADRSVTNGTPKSNPNPALKSSSESSSLAKKVSCDSVLKEESQHDAPPLLPPRPLDRHPDPMENYVQFSKEKYLLDSPPEKLRRELEEELKLSSSDLRSHGWYHGPVPREVSETLVLRNGDFLIRDCLTNAGDYVLTCRWNHEVLHFKITKVLIKSSESRVQYLLEQESFDSVPALVCSYMSQRRPVSLQSSAQIYCPINRTLPLRYLEATFALANGRKGSSHSPSNQRGAFIKRRSVTMTDGLTTEKIIPHSPSTVHHKEAMRNCALSMDQIQEFRCPLSPVGEAPLSPAYSSVTKHRNTAGVKVLEVVPSSPVLRRSSEPQLSPSSSTSAALQELASGGHPPTVHGYLSDAAGGSYCELHPTPSPSPAPPPKSYVERLRVEEGRTAPPGKEDGGEPFTAPLVETVSSFNPSKYHSALMGAENKPLEMGILKRVKELLGEADAKMAAKHITKADCTVARILGVTKEMQKMMGVGSGLELLTLPHGQQLRLDLLERFYTMSIMVAVDLLGCTGSTEERASLLHKTIQLAAELKSGLGNMFGFAAVMRALELPQISRLQQTWSALRQRHTEGAILYEKKLKPFMKNMNDGKESCALSNTSFPHIIPLLSLLEKGVVVIEGAEPWESTETGVDVVMSHLEAARTIAHHGGIYCTNAETKLQGFQEKEDLLEVFCTEFQMRLLWGSRGAEGSQAERYEKFDKVLTALSNKLEPPVKHSEL
ncbi:SH2 domain-containing protein 3C isoform X1 [Brienomyrus brachyistius]|uniref:SH2 domain-containing protein 3C isoform X1 n=1 Tax=Brienomyrus brachyistius TaxID=42636 RepID=UPI0020B3474F|nr:SH2 domain-containing protein 3C isoform X1 [Brienomyrus brachyistius]